MKNFIAISVFRSNDSDVLELTEVLNRLLCTPVLKDIFVYDVTTDGIGREMKALLRSYSKYRVVSKRVKTAGGTENRNKRINMGVAHSLMEFNIIRTNKYATYTHIYQNMYFENFDFQLLVSNAQLYSALSPVIDSINGIEVLSAIFDRYGIEYFDLGTDVTHHITGAIEESYALNPKCFSMSRSYANKIAAFTYSDELPVEYLNKLMYSFGKSLPKLDTSLFVHENLY